MIEAKEFTLKDNKQLTCLYPVPDDASRIIAYLNMVGGETDFLSYGLNEFPISVEEEFKFIESWRKENKNLMLMGLVDGEVASMLTLGTRTNSRTKHCATFGITVAKKYWHLGIARSMMERMQEWIERSADYVKKIELEVDSRNERAIKLYQNFGFEVEGKRLKAFCIDGQYLDNTLMGYWRS